MTREEETTREGGITREVKITLHWAAITSLGCCYIKPLGISPFSLWFGVVLYVPPNRAPSNSGLPGGVAFSHRGYKRAARYSVYSSGEALCLATEARGSPQRGSSLSRRAPPREHHICVVVCFMFSVCCFCIDGFSQLLVPETKNLALAAPTLTSLGEETPL